GLAQDLAVLGGQPGALDIQHQGAVERCSHDDSLTEFGSRPLRARRLADHHRTVRWYAWEELQQVGIAQAHTAVGQRHAHGLGVRRAVKIDVAAEGIDPPQAIEPRLAAAEPEDAGENPVAAGEAGVELRGPDLAGPAPTAQHRALGQAL